MRKSDAEVTEAIDLYKALRDDIPYGPEDKSAEPQQQDCLPTKYEPDAYYTAIQNSAPQEIDCFTIVFGKETGTTFPVDIHNQQVNALYDTGAGCSLINYSMHEKLGIDLDKGYQPIVKSSTGENMGVLGQVTFTFKINETPFTQSFIVCRHMTRHMILDTQPQIL